MNEHIGQQLIIGLCGKEITTDESCFIIENNIGGVILFERNLGSLEEIHKLIHDIHSLGHQTKQKVPLFVSVDMEGGRVQRVKAPFTLWPAVKHLGEIGSSSMAFGFARCMGEELEAVGFNLNYAPCVDVLTHPENHVIGDRALGCDPKTVASLAPALVEGYQKAGILSCAKHFPGHGFTCVDSHLDLPVDTRSLKELKEKGDLLPFQKVIQSKVDMIMTAHILYPNIDPKLPATLSPLFIEKLLRQTLGFNGLVITDDLDMKALTGNFSEEQICLLALKAGANVLLYCNQALSPVKAVESIKQALMDGKIPRELIERNSKKIQSIKAKKLKLPLEPPDIKEIKQILGCRKHKSLADKIAQKT